MSDLKADCQFIGGACNTVADGVAWFTHGSEDQTLLAFSTSNLVSIANPNLHSPQLICTLKGHEKNVTAISCLQSVDGIIELVSGSEDGAIKIWRHQCKQDLTFCACCNVDEWECIAENSFLMDSAVVALTTLSTSSGAVIAASGASGHICIWCRSESSLVSPNAFVLVETTLQPPSQMAHRLHLVSLPSEAASATSSDGLMLLIGSVDSRIYVWTSSFQSMICPPMFGGVNSSRIFQVAGVLSGHEEWVTCMCSTITSQKSLFIASGSQDCKVRIWRVELISSNISNDEKSGPEHDVEDLVPNEEDDEVDEFAAPEKSESMPGNHAGCEEEESAEARLHFTALTRNSGTSHQTANRYAVFLEALLVGHEDWVTNINWVPRCKLASAPENINKSMDEFRLYSASMDRNMVLWCPDLHSGVWLPAVRVGDIGGMLGGSVGANLLGFVGGCVSPTGDALVGVGYGGSLHVWSKLQKTQQQQSRLGLGNARLRKEIEDSETWEPCPFLTGHFAEVVDCAWIANGDSLASVSSDQTCRVFCELFPDSEDGRKAWREISRPIVHGYNLTCIASLPVLNCVDRSSDSFNNQSPFAVVIGSDEKIIRVYDAPQVVVTGMASLAHIACAKFDNIYQHRFVILPNTFLLCFLMHMGMAGFREHICLN